MPARVCVCLVHNKWHIEVATVTATRVPFEGVLSVRRASASLNGVKQKKNERKTGKLNENENSK